MYVRLLSAAWAFAWLACADPQPGDVFREFTYTIRFSELDPASKRPGIDNLRRDMQGGRNLHLPDLKGVRKAEVSVEYWGGHIGTTDQKFQVNDNGWILIPQPSGTAGKPQCYYRNVLGRATSDVPLAQLRAGLNVFRFTAGPQACYGFDWGFYWVYAFTVRLYYDASVPHPSGELLTATGSMIADDPKLTVRVKPSGAPISRVDFVGEYEDFNWEGDGVARQWHYITEKGVIGKHIGTATAEPYSTTWHTLWVPDQSQPVRLAARITDSHGMMSMTPAVSVNLRRRGRSVRLFPAVDVPERFGVRVGTRMECKIPVGNTPGKLRAARLVLSTWSAAHADELGLNGTKLTDRVGYVHNYSFDSIFVPVDVIKTGTNVFHIFATTQEHAAEVNWPGPALLLEFTEKD
jgi:hypothetical protein